MVRNKIFCPDKIIPVFLDTPQFIIKMKLPEKGLSKHNFRRHCIVELERIRQKAIKEQYNIIIDMGDNNLFEINSSGHVSKL